MLNHRKLFMIISGAMMLMTKLKELCLLFISTSYLFPASLKGEHHCFDVIYKYEFVSIQFSYHPKSKMY